MLSIEFKDDNKFTHLRVLGHAEYKKDGSFDIVCGMVSAIAQTAIYGCRRACADTRFKRDKGFIELYFPKTNKVAKAIAEACYYGIGEVKRQYPSCFK